MTSTSVRNSGPLRVRRSRRWTNSERRLGATVRQVERDKVEPSDGTRLPARTVVWTAGIQASPLTVQIPGDRDRLGRLVTDPYLRVCGVDGVHAAGDTAAAPAEEGYMVMPRCQHAFQLGRYAGHNVAADLLARPRVPFQPDPYVTCLDLGGAGAVVASAGTGSSATPARRPRLVSARSTPNGSIRRSMTQRRSFAWATTACRPDPSRPPEQGAQSLASLVCRASVRRWTSVSVVRQLLKAARSAGAPA
ncbi:FAD-dependent oxidoreductase [Actinomadura sp. NTSP31]|uniref:FAD-dependent oxidoreductase n=1 Tax=Actinomadura sp. NTSP31 TaxID=1735447 RepID=UPI0035C1A4BA